MVRPHGEACPCFPSGIWGSVDTATPESGFLLVEGLAHSHFPGGETVAATRWARQDPCVAGLRVRQLLQEERFVHPVTEEKPQVPEKQSH